MPFNNEQDFGFDAAKEAAPSINNAEELISKMVKVLSTLAGALPHLPLEPKEANELAAIGDAIARDRDNLQSIINSFKTEVHNLGLDKGEGADLTLYSSMVSFSTRTEEHAAKFAGHMSSITSIEAISKIL